jgi:hypothetical protein
MKIPRKVVETIEAKYVRFHAKMRDEGTYILLDESKNEIKEHEGYVPSFFPYGVNNEGEHYGDYVDLVIDLETGIVANWKAPEPMEVARAFGLIEDEL